MKILITLLALALFSKACLASGVDAPITSLFFTPKQTAEVEIMAQDIARESTPSSGIHLGAVIFYGVNNWKIWIQNKEWTPETRNTDLQVLDVTPTEVRLKWNGTASLGPQEVHLKPHQTFQTSTGRIIEGLR